MTGIRCAAVDQCIITVEAGDRVVLVGPDPDPAKLTFTSVTPSSDKILAAAILVDDPRGRGGRERQHRDLERRRRHLGSGRQQADLELHPDPRGLRQRRLRGRQERRRGQDHRRRQDLDQHRRTDRQRRDRHRLPDARPPVTRSTTTTASRAPTTAARAGRSSTRAPRRRRRRSSRRTSTRCC